VPHERFVHASILADVLDLRSLLEMRHALPLDFDGRLLLIGSNAPGTQQLFIAGGEGGDLVQITDEDEPVSGLFLPDGRVLVEIDDGGNERSQLYRISGDELEPIVVDTRFIHRTPHARGDTLAYATNRGNGVDFEVVARSLSTGEERTFDLRGNLGVEAVSPDGRWVVAERLGERSADNDLFLCDVENGDVVHATPHDESAEFYAPVWLNGSLVYASNQGRDTFAIMRDGKVVHETEWDVFCVADVGGHNVLAVANEDGYSRLTLLDPETFEMLGDVPLPGRGVVENAIFSPDGEHLAFSFSSPVAPRDVYVYDVEDGELIRVTTSPHVVEPERLVEPTLHRFESFDGESVPVFLFEPPGEGPFPVVVTVHGGPEAQWLPWFSPSFAPLTQYLVSRGYAVAAPNVRGSSGYGKRYQALDDIERRLDSVRDLASLHEWLSARPSIDGSRAVVYGRSYGGYMVLAALAFQPELWAAGLEAVGISSLVTFLQNTSPYRRAAREREYGSLAHDLPFLERASPMTHIDAIRAPLFIQHGRNDPRVPVSESEHIHAVLTEKGIPCELLIFEDEGHTVEKLANRIETFTRMTAFLDRVLAE
jgi:dipeptidyl aminopeptidase/acylaminoacyl peptidase